MAAAVIRNVPRQLAQLAERPKTNIGRVSASIEIYRQRPIRPRMQRTSSACPFPSTPATERISPARNQTTPSTANDVRAAGVIGDGH